MEHNFNQMVSDKVLLTNITYIYYGKGKCAYFSIIKDGFTKQIPAYDLSKEMKTAFVINTPTILRNNQTYKVSKRNTVSFGSRCAVYKPYSKKRVCKTRSDSIYVTVR